VEQTQLSVQRQRINNDLRMRTAGTLYEEHEEGAFLLHKTTRAGCTTAMVAESINRREQFTCVVPTNTIADKTIVEDAKKYCDTNVNKIIHIPSNHKCIRNEEMCEQYPDLKHLPILPLAENCEKCEEYDVCPVTEIVRYPTAEGCVVTYSKLVALMLAARSGTGRSTSKAEEILINITRSKNMIFDEIHEMQYGRSSAQTIYSDNEMNKHIDINRYLDVIPDYPELGKVILSFSKIIRSQEINTSRFEVLDAANNENFYEQHLRITHINKWRPDKCEYPKFSMACYSEIIDLTKNKTKYNLCLNDILALYNMLSISISYKILVHGIKDKGKTRIRLVAVDWMYTGMVASYFMSIENKNKRMWLTSATICSYDYRKLFMNENKLQSLMFGDEGDPMNTNGQMLIIADTKKYHAVGRESLFTNQEKIVQRI